MAVKSYSYSTQKNVKLSKHFTVGEFASINNGKLYSDTVKIDPALITILERLYDFLGCSSIVITSGYRTSEHEKAVGNSSGKGYHTTGQAADINCWHVANGKAVRYHGSVVCCALQELGWKHGIGWIAGCAVHVDTRLTKYWFDEQNSCKSIGNDWYSYMKNKGYTIKKVLLGDVDGDGKITSTDARKVLQASVGKVKLSQTEQGRADVDGDGKITSTDARKILQKSTGKDSF